MGMMELLTVREVAAYLKTTRQQVRRMIQCGELRAVKVGRGVPHHPGRPGGVSGRVAQPPYNKAPPQDGHPRGGFFSGLSVRLISVLSVRNSLKSFHKIDDNGKERAVLPQKERIPAC